jgi:hypothetical protein
VFSEQRVTKGLEQLSKLYMSGTFTSVTLLERNAYTIHLIRILLSIIMSEEDNIDWCILSKENIL